MTREGRLCTVLARNDAFQFNDRTAVEHSSGFVFLNGYPRAGVSGGAAGDPDIQSGVSKRLGRLSRRETDDIGHRYRRNVAFLGIKNDRRAARYAGILFGIDVNDRRAVSDDIGFQSLSGELGFGGSGIQSDQFGGNVSRQMAA